METYLTFGIDPCLDYCMWLGAIEIIAIGALLCFDLLKYLRGPTK